MSLRTFIIGLAIFSLFGLSVSLAGAGNRHKSSASSRIEIAASTVKRFDGEWVGNVRNNRNSDCAIDTRISRAVVQDGQLVVQFQNLGTRNNLEFKIDNGGRVTGDNSLNWSDHAQTRHIESFVRVTGGFDGALFRATFIAEDDDLGIACSGAIELARKGTIAASNLLAGSDFEEIKGTQFIRRIARLHLAAPNTESINFASNSESRWIGYIRMVSDVDCEIAKPPDMRPPNFESTLARRLRLVKEWLDQGLITEIEAAEKRREILRGL